ncbi:MAG: hypothetical protein ABIH65_02935 [Nanoarchaeota archaeon]
MLKKFLKDAVTLIAGKQTEEIVDLLDTSKYINEFIIAKKLGVTINQARNILYKISDYGLVSSIRKKDKKKGWYTYFWKIEILKSLEFVKNDLLKKKDQFEHQIKSRETKRFYVCEKCAIELNEENSLLHNFTCPECGFVLTIKDNTKLIKEMKKNLEKSKKDIILVEEEIRKESEKYEQKRLRDIKNEERKKKKNKLKKLGKGSKKTRPGVAMLKKQKVSKKKKKKILKKQIKKKTHLSRVMFKKKLKKKKR